MMTYSVIVRLSGAPAAAVAVEWTDRDAPDLAWQPCRAAGPGLWRFASRTGDEARHLRAPGRWTGLAIRYRLEPAGPWSEPSADRKEIEILAVPGGEGGAGGGMSPPPFLPPALVAAPLLLGSGKIGQAVTVETGTWTAAADLAVQWLRDGAPIEGATASAYMPEAADDRTALAARVTATGPGGSGEAVTAALPITRVAPVARVTEIIDEIHDAGAGTQLVETAGFFSGEALVFAVTGAGATIDPATGRVSLPTDTPRVEEMVVTAANSGGEAVLRFLVTIEAPVAPVLLALGPQDWSFVELAEDPAHAGQVTAIIEFAASSPAGAAIAAYWTDTATPQEIGHPCWDLGIHPATGRRRFRLRPSWRDTNTWHVRAPGQTKDNIAVRYQIEGTTVGQAQVSAGTPPMTAEYQAAFASPWSTDRKSFTVPAGFFAGSGAGPLRPLTGAQAQAAASTSPPNGHNWVEGKTRNATETPSGTVDIYDNVRPLSLAWHAAAGNQTHDARLVALVKRVLNVESAQLRHEGGYGFQHESPLLAAIAIVRNVPRLWAQFDATERRRAELTVETACWAGMVMISDTNPYVSGAKSGAERPIRGLDSTGQGRTWNPNYRLANTAGIAAAIAFHSADGADGGAVMNAKRASYTFTTHRDALQSAGLSRPRETWSGTWSNSFTGAELQATIRSFAHFGVPFSNWREIVRADTRDCFNRNVIAGLNNGNGWFVDGQHRGRIMRNANGLPHPVGTPGMAKEYDSTDAGGNLGFPNQRSSAQYVTLGLKVAISVWAPLIVAGQVDRRHQATVDIWNRMRVGFDDHLYKWNQGYFNFSHGGTRLGDWELTGASAFRGNPGIWGKVHWLDGVWPAMRAWFFDR